MPNHSPRFILLFPISRAKVLECSAKDDFNVTDLFKTLLSLSRIMPAGSNEATTGLKRRSSAYVSASSKGKWDQILSLFVFRIGQNYPVVIYTFLMFFFCSGKSRISSPSVGADKSSQLFTGASGSEGGNAASENKLKPRSRYGI